jgi:hypothetical protein
MESPMNLALPSREKDAAARTSGLSRFFTPIVTDDLRDRWSSSFSYFPPRVIYPIDCTERGESLAETGKHAGGKSREPFARWSTDLSLFFGVPLLRGFRTVTIVPPIVHQRRS